VRAPGVTRAGSVCEQPVCSTDFYPTILELGGLPSRPAQHQDGRSLVPLLGGKPFRRGPIFWHYPHYGNQGGAPGGVVRDEDWKLIEWYEDGRLELFRLSSDLAERYNVAKLYPEKAAAMQAQLQAWLRQVEATMPPRNPAYDPQKPPGR